MTNHLLKLFVLLPVLLATGCATTTKNFEPGVLPEYATVSEKKLQENEASLRGIMGKK